MPSNKAAYRARPWACRLLIAVMVLQAVAFVEARDGTMLQERVLHFPPDRSLGTLYVQDASVLTDDEGVHYWIGSHYLTYLAEAMGDVTVPADKQLYLHLAVDKSTADNLSGLSRLKPDDLYAVSIVGYDTRKYQGGEKPNDECMQHLRHLTGLRVLHMSDIDITQKGLGFIADLQSLKHLSITNAGKLGNADLVQLAKIKSLEELHIRLCPRITHEGLRHLSSLTSLRELTFLATSTRIRGPGLAQLANLPSLRSLDLAGNKGLGDSELKYLEKAISIRKLDLKHVPITGVGFAHLSNLTGLEELDLYKTRVSDKGLIYLKPMRSLKKLNIGSLSNSLTQITDAGMAHVGQIKSLEILSLPSSITDKGLADLAGLSNLKSLMALNARNISDEGLRHLTQLQSLETLHLRGYGITDIGMPYVAQLTKLQDLMLGCSKDDPITDEGLAKLTALKSLKALSIGSPKITISGLSCLNALPDLTALSFISVIQDNTGLNIAGLTKLERLKIGTEKGSGTAIRDEDLACLSKLIHLKSLQTPQSSKDRRAISDTGMAHLAGLTSMEILWIGGPGITDKGLSYLANMKDMKNLNITGNFTEQGLRHLEGLKHLDRLRVYSKNKLSNNAVQRLKTSLPEVRIFEVKQSKDAK